MAKCMIKKGSPHVIAFNPNFEHDSNYVLLPDDFDLVGYQAHMVETKGKPTKTVRAFFKDAKPTPIPEETDWNEFKADKKPEPEFADGLKEELNIVDEPVATEEVIENVSVMPEIKDTNPSPQDLVNMRKSEIVKMCNELGISVDEDMLKRNMIIKVKEFLEEKKKANDMKKINDGRFPNV